MIEKTKRKGALCGWCHKPINSKYRARNGGNLFHISCYRKQIVQKLDYLKKEFKELNKTKYNKVMILEELE